MNQPLNQSDIEPTRLNPSRLTKKSHWNDFKFWLVLHNPCYGNSKFVAILEWLFHTPSCICCTLVRTSVISFVFGIIWTLAALRLYVTFFV